MDDDQQYSVTIKYTFRHSRGELVPSADDVREALEKKLGVGDELMVHTEQEVDETQCDGFGDPQPTGNKIKHFEGCRVVVEDVDVQEARRR